MFTMIFRCLCSLRFGFVAILQRIGIISLNTHQNIDTTTSDAVGSKLDEPRLHEVFISFRGEDTRNNFATHLHSELVRRGIRTYLDTENLTHGQTLADELPKSIQESNIAIVILSTNYGSSTWCLRELVKIMECKINFGLHVFPIFYNINPSDVRKQRGSFSKAFSDHEKSFKDDAETVKSWRKALKEVGDLVGEDTRGKNELSCIKNIADKILRKLHVKASRFRNSVVGIESRISEIKKLMYSKPNEVLFIGMWGMGGIGKTTTARAIFEDCNNEFEGSCFLRDVRQSKDKLEKLHEKLLSNVLKIKFEGLCDVIEGSSIIQERLQFKKVLLVIDDVDDIEQLNALVKECDWFGKGSVIIITTRDDHLLDNVYVKKYDVQTLPKNKALHLFCLHVFKNKNPPKDYKDLSLQVLMYAGGLPLALQVLGDHLYRREISIWKSTLCRLKDVPQDKIISKLQISFEGLNILQQNIFLDIACFFRGSLQHEVEKRLQSLNLHPKEGIDVLVQRSLIYLNIKFDMQVEYLIEMHDLLQEMGWHIIRQRANWDVRRYSRLWLKEDIVKVLSDITVSSEVEGICSFSFYGHDVLSRLDWEAAFRKMNQLSFLELGIEGNYDVIVPQSSAPLYNYNLRWVSLSYYPGQCLPKSFHPINLVHLSLKHSKIEETPDFSHMPNLEELDFCFSSRLVHVHPSLGDHKKIKRVCLEYCKKLEEFPEINQMESLEILNLRDTNLKRFPEIYGNLDSLRQLHVWRTSINGLPASIVGNATRLQKMELACGRPYNEEFTSLEVVAKSFPGLVSLQITGSPIVRTLDFSNLPYLEKLGLSFSAELVEVHASLGVHKRIKSINLSYCSKLVEFPRIIDMNSLEELNLSYTSLKRFPEMTGNVNRLVRLDLCSTKITTLPWSIGRATGLEVISMDCCEYLLTLPISFLGLQLQIVTISRGVLKSFSDETGQAVKLHSSQRKRRKQLTVSEGMGRLSALHIYYGFCRSIEELPEPLLARVESLTIKACPNLTRWISFNLVELLDNYQHLLNLQLHQNYDMYPHDFLQAFSEWEFVSNMLRKREESFIVNVPGSQIPSWLQYRINRHSATAFLPPLAEWDSDNLRGFVLSGINAESAYKKNLPTPYGFSAYWPQLHVFILYMPVNNIRNWEGQIERTLFKLKANVQFEELASWGLSLVYNEEIVNVVHPRQVRIVIDDDARPDSPRFRVKIEQSNVGING